jgi:hypothetical protein
MGAGQEAGPNLVTAHELVHVVRGDAVNRVCCAPGDKAGLTVISPVWRVNGRDIDGFDAQIASICRSSQCALATRNVKDFEHTGVDLIDPWQTR